MFERFTEGARSIVVEAQAHARGLGHDYIGCEHLLLAVASSESDAGEVLRAAGASPPAMRDAIGRLIGTCADTLDRDALAAIGIDLDRVRETAEAAFGPHALARPRHPARARRWRRRRCSGGGHIPFTPRAKKALELSLREATALRHRHIGVEHIALALTRIDDTAATAILRALGTPPAHVRAELLRRYPLAG